MPFKVFSGVEQFCIGAPMSDEESPCVEWEQVSAIKIGKEVYLCVGDPKLDDQVVERVVSTIPVDTITEHVVFEDESEDEEGEELPEGEEGDEEDGEEEEEVGPELVK